MTPTESLNMILEASKTAGADLVKSSKALGASAITTGEIAFRAGSDLVAGKIDREGALRVAERGFDQMKTLAVAEGNLTAVAFVGWLKTVTRGILAMLPIPGI